MKTLNEWLNYLENRHQTEVQLRLVNTRTIAERLDLFNVLPHVITVAGTNGKGSTVTTLEAIYCAAGYRVGAYTSPHVLVFNERIRVNQQPIADDALCSMFAAIEEVSSDISLTYFEMATLAALLYFKQSCLDIIILEVGVGGRLDATNIIDSDLAIITTVDLDHQDYLGDNVEAIGYEKAGILRANQSFIYADQNPPQSVINQAKNLNTTMYCFEHDYHVTTTDDVITITIAKQTIINLPKPNINIKAAAAAIVASVCLSKVLPIQKDALVKAMKSVFIIGRLQLITGEVNTLLDVAHNPQSVSLLADFMAKYEPKGVVHAVFSGLKDKDLSGLIRPMHPYVTYWYPALLSGKRAADETLLLEALKTETQAIPVCFENPKIAYKAAQQLAKPGDLIVVYGSFLMVGAVMAIHNEVLL